VDRGAFGRSDGVQTFGPVAPCHEFKRHLYDINPVGVGAGFVHGGLDVGQWGLLGTVAEAFAPLIALVVAFVAAPVLAAATRGRFYFARVAQDQPDGLQSCTICENAFEAPDMAHCPLHKGRSVPCAARWRRDATTGASRVPAPPNKWWMP
jgi:hypothetical protein